MHLKKIQYSTQTLASKSRNNAQHPQHHETYAPAKFEVAKFNRLGDAFDLGIKVMNIAQHPQHHVTYAPEKFEYASSTV